MVGNLDILVCPDPQMGLRNLQWANKLICMNIQLESNIDILTSRRDDRIVSSPMELSLS